MKSVKDNKGNKGGKTVEWPKNSTQRKGDSGPGRNVSSRSKSGKTTPPKKATTKKDQSRLKKSK